MNIQGILNFIDSRVSIGFDVKPLEAINYFKNKGLKTTFSYEDMLAADHVNNFTIAKMMDMDLLQDMYDSLLQAQKKGWTLQQWKDRMIPHLQANGWWGRQAVKDPITGKTIVSELGSSRRLDIIFRTNMQAAYAAGQWQQIKEQERIAPYLMYNAVDDYRTREEHRAWDNKIYPVSHPFWFAHTPPNGWNCRCGILQFSKSDLDDLGYEVSEDVRQEYKDWKNPRTGLIEKIPVGVDPGFNFNAGQARYEQLQNLAKEKAQAIKDKALREAAEEALVLVEMQAKALSSSGIMSAPKNSASKMNNKDTFSQPPTETFSIYDAGALPIKLDTSTPLKKAVITLENEIRKDKLETGAVFDKDGLLLSKNQGLPDRVSFNDDELKLLKNNVFTHNHPNGTTFSLADIERAIENNLLELRVVTSSFRFSLSAPNGWPAIIALGGQIDSAKRRANHIVNDKVRMGEIKPQFAEAEYLHYILVLIAVEFNLIYTREKS